MAGTPEAVSVEMEIGDGETVIRITGTRDAALVVYSESGEEVYLPPEGFGDPPDAGGDGVSPYGSGAASQTPYDGVAPADSPYGAGEEGGRPATSDAEGAEGDPSPVVVEPTEEGFRVRHPEPITDLRFVR